MNANGQDTLKRAERAEFSASRLNRASQLIRSAWGAAALLCLSFTLIVTLTLLHDFDAHLTSAQQRVNSVAMITARGLALSLDGAVTTAQAASTQILTNEQERTRKLTSFFFTTAMTQSMVDRLIFINPVGRVSISSLPDDPLVGQKITLPRAWLKAHQPTLVPYHSSIDGVAIALTVRNKNKDFLGMVVAVLNRNILTGILREDAISPLRLNGILHDADTVIASHPTGFMTAGAVLPESNRVGAFDKQEPNWLAFDTRIKAEKQVGNWPLWVDIEMPLMEALRPFWMRLALWVTLTLGLMLTVVMATRSHVAYVLRLYLQSAVIERQNVDLRAAATRLEKEIRERNEAEDQRDNFFNLSGDMLAILDVDGRFIRANPAFERLFGEAHNGLSGISLASFMHPDDVDDFRRALETLDEDGPARSCELRLQIEENKDSKHNRQTRWFLWTLVSSSGLVYAVAHDFTDHREAADALREAKESAELANATKTRFLANMSHELRTPLNAIIGFSQTLDLGLYGPLSDKQHEYVRDIQGAGEHLLTIVSDLLDLSVIDSGAMVLTEREVMVADMVQAAFTLVRAKADAAHIKLQAHFYDPYVRVKVDNGKIQQILVNLLGNAIRFSPAGSTITVRTRIESHDGGLLIEVVDQGTGIKPSDLPQVLSPFGRLKSEFARNHGGVGLGLPLARRLAELHDGELSITSEYGHGTTVRLWLPKSRLLAPIASARSPL